MSEKGPHVTISIRRETRELLQKAVIFASANLGENVPQVEFLHQALIEKVERDGLPVPADLLAK